MELLLLATNDIITIAVAGGIVAIFLIVALAGGFRHARRVREERAAEKAKEKQAAEKKESEKGVPADILETENAATSAVKEDAQAEEERPEPPQAEEPAAEQAEAPVSAEEAEKPVSEERAEESVGEEQTEESAQAEEERPEPVQAEEPAAEQAEAPVSAEETEETRAEETEDPAAEETEGEGSEISAEKEETATDLFGGKFLVTYDRSFRARLIQAVPEVQTYYTELKNHLLSYKKMTSRVSWNAESFRIGRKLYAKMTVRGKMLRLYLAADPAQYENTKYRSENAGDSAKYAEVPFKFEVKSERRLGYAKTLIDEMMAGAPQGEIPSADYREEYVDTDVLLEQGLIKIKKVSRGDMEGKEIAAANIADLVRNKISIGEADAAVADEVAVKFIEIEERGNVGGKKAIVNLDSISANFAAGETVTAEKLKEKKLIPLNAGFVKVLARGFIDKPLTVEANDFSLAAVKMLVLTGGKAVQIK